jgi:anti-anti-sigma factor
MSSGVVVVAGDVSGVPVVKLAGEVDISNVDAVRAAVVQVVSRAPGQLIFDLSGLTFMDSSGIAVLLQSAERVNVEVRNPSPVVRRIFECTGIADILHVDQ